MKQLTVTIHVDPAAAVRAGKTQVGECAITLSECQLALLTDVERETLARHLDKYEKHLEPYYEVLGRYSGDFSLARYGDSLDIGADPVPDASINSLKILLSARDRRIQEHLLELDERVRLKRESAAREVAQAIIETHIVTKHVKSTVYTEIPEIRYVGETTLRIAGEELAQQYFIEKSKRETDAAKALEAANRLADEVIAAEEKEAAEQKRLYDIEYQRLPEEFRARQEAGYGSPEEVEDALRALFRADANYPAHQRYEYVDSRKICQLTDEEFKRLQTIEKYAPEGATCTPTIIFEGDKYRPATDEDDPEDIDSDGDVRQTDEERGAKRVVLVEWTRVGIDVRVEILL